jgi:hypothetical protein
VPKVISSGATTREYTSMIHSSSTEVGSSAAVSAGTAMCSTVASTVISSRLKQSSTRTDHRLTRRRRMPLPACWARESVTTPNVIMAVRGTRPARTCVAA